MIRRPPRSTRTDTLFPYTTLFRSRRRRRRASCRPTPSAAKGQGEGTVMTYSIVARDAQSGHLGVSVASRFFAVGALVPHLRAGVGALATQAFRSEERRVGNECGRTVNHRWSPEHSKKKNKHPKN